LRAIAKRGVSAPSVEYDIEQQTMAPFGGQAVASSFESSAVMHDAS